MTFPQKPTLDDPCRYDRGTRVACTAIYNMYHHILPRARHNVIMCVSTLFAFCRHKGTIVVRKSRRSVPYSCGTMFVLRHYITGAVHRLQPRGRCFWTGASSVRFRTRLEKRIVTIRTNPVHIIAVRGKSRQPGGVHFFLSNSSCVDLYSSRRAAKSSIIALYPEPYGYFASRFRKALQAYVICLYVKLEL